MLGAEKQWVLHIFMGPSGAGSDKPNCLKAWLSFVTNTDYIVANGHQSLCPGNLFILKAVSEVLYLSSDTPLYQFYP